MMRNPTGSIMVYSVIVSKMSYKWITDSLMNNPDTLEGNVVNLANNSQQGVRHVINSCRSKHTNLRNEDEDLIPVQKIIYLHIPKTTGQFKGPQTGSPVEIIVNNNTKYHSPPPTTPDNSNNIQTSDKLSTGTVLSEDKDASNEDKDASNEDDTTGNFDFFIHVFPNLSSLEGIYNFLSGLHLVYTVIPLLDSKTRRLYEKMFRQAESVIEVIETGLVPAELKGLPLKVDVIDKLQHLADEHRKQNRNFRVRFTKLDFSLLNENSENKQRLNRQQIESNHIKPNLELELQSHFVDSHRSRITRPKTPSLE